MDTRSSVERALGLAPGDAHVLRNAGGIVTGDVLRSLLLSHHALGTREVMIVNHTDCGLASLREEEFREALRSSGLEKGLPETFHAFADVEANVREQLGRLRRVRWTAQPVAVRGFVFDVRTHALREVTP
jgi:carbonic anhydrase